MRQTLVVGDLHGCYAEFETLLDKAGLVEGDQILSLGDCVDRGPETPEVLSFFQTHPGNLLCMGNHERKHVRGAAGELTLALSQKISKLQFGDKYPAALKFMQALPLYVELPDALCAHGYFEPGVSLDHQKPMILCGTMGGERYLVEQYAQPWYELYSGEVPILVGHKNYSESNEPFVYRDKVFGLDTSCVMGKALTGLLLPAFRFVSVPSRKNHWESPRREYADQMRTERALPQEPVWSAKEDERLEYLIQVVAAATDKRLRVLQADPSYANLRPRQQASVLNPAWPTRCWSSLCSSPGWTNSILSQCAES
ncbi:MAG: hypothetical protein EPO32_09785 [Anaerolineae bacterium]|nr:MAG: hypothetical protein EPO32_09785 [Anaerolineae bacterium]